MELGEAEPLGVLYEHDRGIRHIDPHLDNRSRHEEVQLTIFKYPHDGLFLLSFHPPVEEPNLEVTEDIPLEVLLHRGRIAERHLLRLFYKGVDYIGLPPLPELPPDEVVNSLPALIPVDSCLNLLPAGREFIYR